MADSRNSLGMPSYLQCKEIVCVDCNRVLDSCRDKDCFENVEVFLTDFGEEIINNATSVRVKCAELIHTDIYTENIQFNHGFYQITVRFYVKVVVECCVCAGKSQDVEGIAVCEKRVVLYGSEGNVKIFKSGIDSSFCGCGRGGKYSTNDPTVVVEAVDPVALSCVIKEHCTECSCCCTPEEIPVPVLSCVTGSITGHRSEKKLYVTLGFFSVIRIERPAQYLIQASEYSVPDKQCVDVCESNPCSVFDRMSFPVNEFYPPSFSKKK